MDGLTFTSELVKALAWPVATVTIVVFLRRPMGRLLVLLKRVKYGDVEAEFGDGVKEATKEAEEVLAIVEDTKTEPTISDRLAGLLALSPNAAVLDAWREVEKTARAMIRRKGVNPPPPSAKPLLIRDFLAKNHMLAPEEQKIFDRLRQLRNVAAHAAGREVNCDDAEAYLSLALGMIDRLNAK